MTEELKKDGIVGWVVYGEGEIEGNAKEGTYYWPISDDTDFHYQMFLTLGDAENRVDELCLDKDEEWTEDKLVIFAVKKVDGVVMIPTHLVDRPVVTKEDTKVTEMEAL